MSSQFARWRTHFFFLVINFWLSTSLSLRVIDIRSPSLDCLLCTIRRLLTFEGSFFRYCFNCIMRKNMILVICTFIDYFTEDGFGRLEWSIFNSRCSLYFFHCILSSFCRKIQKGDCLVAIFAAKLELNCVLFLYTCNDTLCQWPISQSSQSRFGFCTCKLSYSSDTHQRNLSSLSSSKNPSWFSYIGLYDNS